MQGFRQNIEFKPSPNFSDRAGHAVEGTVIHYTGGGRASGTIRWMQDERSKVSYHFIISRLGVVTQLVDVNQAAWHAGISQTRYRNELVYNRANKHTIGIALANHGRLELVPKEGYVYQVGNTTYPYKGEMEPKRDTIYFDAGLRVEGYWEPYATEQINALHHLLGELQTSGYSVYPLEAHSDIALPVGRKLDPGPLFPWKKFRGRGDMKTHCRGEDGQLVYRS